VVSFTPRERTLGTHWIGGWVGTTAGLDTVVKRKISQPVPQRCTTELGDRYPFFYAVCTHYTIYYVTVWLIFYTKIP
jgi:hypothetical protein